MYKKQISPLAIQSQNWIAESLMRLMDVYSFHEITVTQICQEAQLVRKTFYRNFEAKEDILHFILDNIFASFRNNYDIQEMSSKEIFGHYYEFLFNYRQLLQCLYRDNMFYLVSQKYIEYMKAYRFFNLVWEEDMIHSGIMDPYVYQFIARGMIGILEQWIAGNFRESIDFLTDLTDNLLKSANSYLK